MISIITEVLARAELEKAAKAVPGMEIPRTIDLGVQHGLVRSPPALAWELIIETLTPTGVVTGAA